jgi:hypothetical protein
MNKNKKYPEEYKLTRSFVVKITLVLIIGCVVLAWLLSNWPKDWLFLCWFSGFGVGALFIIMQNIEYALFNHKGVLIVHTKRWGKNKSKNQYYIDWKDVKFIRFGLSYRTPTIDITSSVWGHGYYETTSLPNDKFASLAKHYSGRDDIMYREYKKKNKTKRKKRGLYEKDW